MAVFRQRLIFWLIKAYLRRSGKVILFSFFLGLLIFFGVAFSAKYFSRFIPTEKKIRIGVIGAYTADRLPPFIVNDISHGLTKIASNGAVLPDAATKWEVKDGGKTYVFHLNPQYRFSDGTPLTSGEINYHFANVKVDTSDPKKIIFHLSDTYSPFLVTTSRPIFKKGYIGIGEYKLSKMHLNGEFVDSLSVNSTTNKFFSQTYVFYPSEEALKHAFVLGEVTMAKGLTNDFFRDTSFSAFPKVSVQKEIDYDRLVAIFFNTQDSYFSDKKIRSALTYALPNSFPQGERSILPYSPSSRYLNHEFSDRQQDIEHAKLLLKATQQEGSASTSAAITIKAAKRYHDVAKIVASSWETLGMKVKIEDEESIPSDFQVYLGDFTLPKDPDQYVLWHSTSGDNITRLKSQRLDKLLEDGRKITDTIEREKIYDDFQKYLLDESPAAFLYFPYDYVVTRS